MFLANISIKRPVFITVIIIALLVVGFLSFSGLSLNDMPQADFPFVTVTITQRGVAPEQLETNVAKKVEEAIGEVSGVKHITTRISEGMALVVIEFVLEKSPDVAAQEVRDKVSGIRRSLPSDIDEPIIAKFDVNASSIISLAVTGDMDKRAISKVVDEIVTKGLNTVNGVGSIKVYGKEEREVQIKADLEKIAAYGLSPAEMVSGIQNGNMESPGGKLVDGEQEISLRTDNNVKNVEDFYNITVGKRGGYDIKVRDVATVSDGIKQKDSMSFYDGKEAIGIDIIKQSGANTVAVADGVKKQLELVKKVLPRGINIDIVSDNSEWIRDSVNDVVKTIIEGSLLAVIIIFIFLREWESTLISAISLPTSIITTFIALKLMNFSLNTMSLMALSLAVGLLIDDAIVVIENVVRHLHMGKPPFQAAKEATSEIGLAVLATTLAVVAVFVPIAMVTGIIGKYFIEFGLTVAFSMLVSLFVSFTLVPMMSSRLLKAERKKTRSFVGTSLNWFNDRFNNLGNYYSKLLAVVLRHRFITLGITILLFVGSMRLIPMLGFSFLPSSDTGIIGVNATLESGLTLDAGGQKAKEIESIVRTHKEVDHIYTTVGSGSISMGVELVDKKDRRESSAEIAKKLRQELKGITGVELAVKSGSFGPESGKDVAFVIRGSDDQKLEAFAQEAKQLLKKDPNARDVSISRKTGKTETKLAVDRDKASDLGINVVMAAGTLQALFDGIDAGKFDWGGDRYNVRVSLKDSQKDSLNSLDGIYVPSSGNQMIPISSVVKKEISTAPATIERLDRFRQIELSANVEGMSAGDFLNKYTNEIKTQLTIPEGIIVQVGGMNEVMQEGFQSLVIAMFMGILFMFMVMAMQFESYIDPIAIMFALPMALIGAVLGLFVAGSELSIMSLIGIIMLMGLVAKNGILLIDFTKQRRNEGINITQALIEAGKVRLRPILMTSLAMIFGMIPVVVTAGAGNELRAPMGHAVIGGLITSTLLTLLVVPVVYSLLDDLKKKFRRKSKVDEVQTEVPAEIQPET